MPDKHDQPRPTALPHSTPPPSPIRQRLATLRLLCEPMLSNADVERALSPRGQTTPRQIRRVRRR